MYLRLIKIKCMLVCCVTLAASASLRVIGGRDARDNEFPYVARLELEITAASDKTHQDIFSAHQCTCSVLTSEWTLTARHCVPKPETFIALLPIPIIVIRYIIRYGSPTGEPLGSRTSYVLEEKFPGTHFYDFVSDDIALLKTEPIKLSQYGKISGADFGTLFYQEVTLVGYGLTNITHLRFSKQTLNSTLSLEKPLQVTKGMLAQCSRFQDKYYLGPLCAHQTCRAAAAICPGDSGGPAVHRSGVVALNAKGPNENNCQMQSDKFRTPFIVALFPLSPYLDWITNVISNQENIK